MISLAAGDADHPERETFRESLLRLLRARLGHVPAGVEEWIDDKPSAEMQEQWIEAALVCTSLDDLRARLRR